MDRGIIILLIIGGVVYYYWKKKEDTQAYHVTVTFREEVVERNKYGQKLVVNTYKGSGESEELVKRTIYKDQVDDVRDIYKDKIRTAGFSDNISYRPYEVYYFGDYKVELSVKEDSVIRQYAHGIIKIEKYDLNTGEVIESSELTEKNGEEIVYMIPESYKRVKGRVNYTLIP